MERIERDPGAHSVSRRRTEEHNGKICPTTHSYCFFIKVQDPSFSGVIFFYHFYTEITCKCSDNGSGTGSREFFLGFIYSQ